MDKYLLAVLFVSMVIYGFFYNSFSAVLFDESTYMLAAKAIVEGKGYTMWVLAPLFSYIIAAFYFVFGSTESVAKLVAPVFSIGSAVAMYYFSKEFLDKKFSAVSAILLITIPSLMVLGERVMTEAPFMFFFILSLLFFIRAAKGNSPYLVSLAVTLVATFLIKYSGVLLLPVFLLYFIVRKDYEGLKKIILNKWTVLATIVAFAMLVPMFLYSQQLFGNPLQLFLVSFSTYNIQADEPWYFYIQNFPIVAAATLPFLLYGSYVTIRRKPENLWLVASILFLFLYKLFFLTVRETRYLIDILPFAVILSSLAFASLKLDRKILVALFCALVLTDVAIGVYAIDKVANDPKYIEMKDASAWAKENCKEPVLSNMGGPLKYYTGFDSGGISDEAIRNGSYGCIVYNKRVSDIKSLDSLTPMKSFGSILVFKK